MTCRGGFYPTAECKNWTDEGGEFDHRHPAVMSIIAKCSILKDQNFKGNFTGATLSEIKNQKEKNQVFDTK